MLQALSYLDELRWRGLLVQTTEGASDALAAGVLSGYCGFDPTSRSLHVGHLVPVMGLVHLQRSGHRPVALVGGGTGLIGDPSGRTAERPLAAADVIEANAIAIGAQLERFLDFEGPSGARLLNNIEWLGTLRAVDFLRDVGKHFTVNFMLAKDSVKSRLDEGVSFTEFSYMLLQAYDFLELYRRAGVTLQIGGSDQWGNITAGVELVRRTVGMAVHGVTLPLVTRADGSKFGKSEGQNIWLDPGLTSPYKFYQFWINADDRDVGNYLRFFTLLEREAIEALDQKVAAEPERREAQQTLAFEVTARVHGEAAARTAQIASRIVFDKRTDPESLSPEALHMLRDEIPFLRVSAVKNGTTGEGDAAHFSVLDLLVGTGLAKSKGDARRLVQQGAVNVNGRKLAGDEHFIEASDAIAGAYFLLRKGAREVALVEIV